MTLSSDIMQKLKRTNDKNNIMREAAEIFYDGEFIKSMDTNKHLLCFNNGVIDFKSKVFREGYPEDYITITTRINYTPFEEDNQEMQEIASQITAFMTTLFPIADLNKYMWDHFASCLIGANKNQTFNVYHGSGSNGKSIIADLMSLTLGEYKGTVPITLVTEKRGFLIFFVLFSKFFLYLSIIFGFISNFGLFSYCTDSFSKLFFKSNSYTFFSSIINSPSAESYVITKY